MTRTLSHYTLTTGHLEESPRSAVGDDILEMLAPMLDDGVHVMPGFTEYTVDVRPTGRMLRADVGGPAGNVVRMWVVVDAADLDRLSHELAVVLDLHLPACIVRLEPGLAAGDVAHWVGDFERCLAWAWVEKIGGSSC